MSDQQARINMVKQQIQPWNVLNEQVLASFMAIPRERFVPPEFKTLAFADTAIPLAHGQQMLLPKEEARILQELDLKPTDTVLEIGTGTGYLTALLASLSNHVFSVDIFNDFILRAQDVIASARIYNTTLLCADAAQGWHEQAPYDVIVIGGSLPFLPQDFKDDLKVGGRLFAILGVAPVMTACVITRTGRREWTTRTIYETVTPPLLNATERAAFVF